MESIKKLLEKPKTLEDLGTDEKSLLLYLETRAVDHGGAVNAQHMNPHDMKIAEGWTLSGFVEFGRIRFEDMRRLKSSHWVVLSPEAWALAHEERRARGKRMWEKRSWLKAREK